MRRAFAAGFAAALALALAADAAEALCPSCGFKCAEGVTNCWACGTHLPEAKRPSEIAPKELLVIGVLPERRRGSAAQTAPEAELEEILKWMAANPQAHEEALERLDALMRRVSGTALAALVDRKMAELRAEVAEANRPKSKEERETDVAKRVPEVMSIVRRNPDRVEENIRRLERLLGLARGTSYETYVAAQLARLRRARE
jgi:hypothetical protein